jgi:hypothetical protein
VTPRRFEARSRTNWLALGRDKQTRSATRRRLAVRTKTPSAALRRLRSSFRSAERASDVGAAAVADIVQSGALLAVHTDASSEVKRKLHAPNGRDVRTSPSKGCRR